jgi:outer membrane protein assembly factor BamB
VIDGDKLFFFVCGAKATVIALNKNTGQTIWASQSLDEKPAYCTPLLFEWKGRKLLGGYTSKHLLGIDTADGAILWKVAVADYSATDKPREAHPNTPIFRDGRLFGTSGYNMGSIMLDLNADGSAVKTVWTNGEFDNHHGSVVLVGDYLYGANWNGNGDGNWMCVEWKTGKTMYDTHWHGKGSLTYADGMLYCYEEKDGNIALVKAAPSGFETISSFKINLGKDQHWAHPVVCGKRLFIRHGDVLMAFDIEAK